MFDIASLLKASGSGERNADPASPRKREFEEDDVEPPTPRAAAQEPEPPTPRAIPLPSSSTSWASPMNSNSSPVSASPSSSRGGDSKGPYGRAPRKEPPKVDTRLEMELEMERAMAYNAREVVPKPGFQMTPLGYEVPIPSSSAAAISQLVSLSHSNPAVAAPVQQEPVNFGPSSPPQPKRRRSLASLLSRSPSKHDDLSSDSHAGRSTTPEPSLTMSNSTSFSQLSQRSVTSADSTNALTVVRKDIGFDKSLPPTPASPSPEVEWTPRLETNDFGPPVASSSKSGSTFGKSISKLRNTGGRNGSGSVFQVISATTTKKPSASNTSAMPLSGAYGHGSRNTPFSSLNRREGLSEMSHSPPPPQPPPSTPFGKRIVEAFGGGKSSSSSSPTKKSSEFDSSTLPSEESSLGQAAPKEGLVRRRSLSGMLIVGDRKPGLGMLGMSLPAARKSEELLGRFGGGRKKSMNASMVAAEQARQSADGAMSAARKSFDLLTQKSEMARRPSTDDLLNHATSQLGRLNTNESQNSIASNASVSSLQVSTSSNLSSASIPSDLGHVEKAQIAHSVIPTRILPPSIDSVRDPGRTANLTPGPALPRSASSASSSYRSAPHTPAVDERDMASNESICTPRGGRESPSPAVPAAASAELALGAVVTKTRSMSPVPAWRATTSTIAAAAAPIAVTTWRKRVKLPDSGLGSDTSMSRTWLDLGEALQTYKAAVRQNRAERGPLVAGTLLAFLRREEDAPSPRVTASLATRQRQILFEWLDVLTTELREMQPIHRGVCLEAVAAILECYFTSATELQDDESSQAQYRSAIVKVLVFAIEKLNDKAVYANTLVFSGRILALAFFRIEGVALKLLRALPPVKKAFLKRILDEVGVNELKLPAVDLEVFPSHLWSLCLRDMKTYTSLLLPVVPKPPTVEDTYLVKDGQTIVEMSGNWLIRWTASDSDLPFAFYRAYHRQLAAHLVPFEAREEFIAQGPVDPSAVVTAPGCLFLAASILEKTDALVHRNLRSVTSIGPNNSNFNTNDSANLSFGQKPKILELANRRVVATMLDIVGGPPTAASETPTDSAGATSDAETRRRVFGKMLQLWIRACVKKTSMWDTRSVFILLDLLEGTIYTLSYPPPSATRSNDEEIIVPRPTELSLEMFDIPFIFSFVKIILTEADNTVTLMRTIAFLYAHFEIFTLRPADRKELCENIILEKVLFPRLYLHWNAGVRGYFIRLLVWRLARLGVVDAEQHPNKSRDPAILALFGLMNLRLEAIRQRHDEIEPIDNLTDDDLFKPKRSTICSTRGVKEAPFAVDELVASLAEDSEESHSDFEGDDDVEQEMMRSAPALVSRPSASDGSLDGSAPSTGGKKGVASVARVVSWLRGGLTKKQQSNKSSISSMEELGQPNSRVNPFILDSVAAKSRADEGSTMTSSSEGSTSHPDQDSSWTTVPSSPDLDSDMNDATDAMAARPSSPAFFAFEFEGAAISPPTSESPAPSATNGPSSSSGASISGASTVSGETVFPQPSLRRQALDPNNAAGAFVSPRVSLRFSKRISILPPAALDLFKESGAPVPAIPERFKPQSYDRKLHQYAVRSLREYEDALDEWTDWVARLQEEEDEGKKFNKGFVDAVPRLAVSWPSSFEAEE